MRRGEKIDGWAAEKPVTKVCEWMCVKGGILRGVIECVKGCTSGCVI